MATSSALSSSASSSSVSEPGTTASSPRTNRPTLTVGPIIGLVTATSARILFEVNAATKLKLTITPLGRIRKSAKASRKKASAKQAPFERSVRLEADRAAVLQLDDLTPNSAYRLEVLNIANTDDGIAEIVTLAEDPRTAIIGAFSCDKSTVSGHDDFISEIAARFDASPAPAPPPFNIILHLGDQVYADSAFKECKRFVKSVGRERAAAEFWTTMVDFYRVVYRETFGNAVMRRIYARASHLMVSDDHEFRNDWGSFGRDKDSSSIDFLCGSAARAAFYEYQRALWDGSIADSLGAEADWMFPAVTGDHYVHTFGSLAVLALDVRLSRSFYFHPDAPAEEEFLGHAQWEFLRRTLSADGTAPAGISDSGAGPLVGVDRLIVVSSIPLVYSDSCMSCCIGCCVKSQRDKMGWGLHRAEQGALLELLESWQLGEGHRDTVVVAGDMHASSVGSVARGDQNVFRQVVASPVANKPPSGFKFWWMKFMSASSVTWANGLRWHREPWVNKRNMAVLSLNDASDDQGHEFEIDIMWAS